MKECSRALDVFEEFHAKPLTTRSAFDEAVLWRFNLPYPLMSEVVLEWRFNLLYPRSAFDEAVLWRFNLPY
jgi:hypothetical protein